MKKIALLKIIALCAFVWILTGCGSENKSKSKLVTGKIIESQGKTTLQAFYDFGNDSAFVCFEFSSNAFDFFATAKDETPFIQKNIS